MREYSTQSANKLNENLYIIYTKKVQSTFGDIMSIPVFDISHQPTVIRFADGISSFIKEMQKETTYCSYVFLQLTIFLCNNKEYLNKGVLDIYENLYSTAITIVSGAQLEILKIHHARLHDPKV